MSSPYERDPKEGTLPERLAHAVALATKLRGICEEIFVEKVEEKKDGQ